MGLLRSGKNRDLVGGVRKTKREIEREKEMKKYVQIKWSGIDDDIRSTVRIPPPQMSEIKRLVGTLLSLRRNKIDFSPKIRELLAQQVVPRMYDLFLRSYRVVKEVGGKRGRNTLTRADLEYVLKGLRINYIPMG